MSQPLLVQINTVADLADLVKTVSGLAQVRQESKRAEETMQSFRLSSGKMAGLGSAVALAQQGFSLLRQEITHVIRDIESIPGVPDSTVSGVVQFRETLSGLHNILSGWIARLIDWFGQMGRGLGMLAAVLFTDSTWAEAGEAMVKQEQEAKDAADAIKRLADGHKVAEANAKSHAEALARLATAMRAWSLVGEGRGQQADRLRAEAEAAEVVAGLVGGRNDPTGRGAAALAEAAEKRAAADAIELAIRQELGALHAEAEQRAMRQLGLAQQIAAQERELAGLKEVEFGSTKGTVDGLEMHLVHQKKILEAEERLSELKERQAQEQKEAAEAAWQQELDRYNRRIDAIDTEAAKLRAQWTPEAIAQATRLEQEKLSLWEKLVAKAQEFAAQAAGARPSVPDRPEAHGAGPSLVDQAQSGYAGLADPSRHYQDAGGAILGETLRMETEIGTTADQVGRTWTDTMRAMRRETAATFSDMLKNGRSFGDAVEGFAQNMLGSFIDSLAQMVTDWILQHTVMAQIRRAFGIAEVTENAAKNTALVTQEATSGAATAAAWTPAAMVKSIVTMGVAVLVGMAAMAAVSGLIRGGRAGGGTVEPGGAYWVGENGRELLLPGRSGYVVPHGASEALMSGGTGGGGVVIEQHIHIDTGVSQTVRAEMLSMLPEIRRQTVAAVEDSRRRRL